MPKIEPQKSEVHDTTDDAGSSPAAFNEIQEGIDRPAMPHGEIRHANIHLDHAKVIRDDTDVGGPLVIESDDPELNPPRVPAEAFPTDRTPEIDPQID